MWKTMREYTSIVCSMSHRDPNPYTRPSLPVPNFIESTVVRSRSFKVTVMWNNCPLRCAPPTCHRETITQKTGVRGDVIPRQWNWGYTERIPTTLFHGVRSTEFNCFYIGEWQHLWFSDLSSTAVTMRGGLPQSPPGKERRILEEDHWRPSGVARIQTLT